MIETSKDLLRSSSRPLCRTILCSNSCTNNPIIAEGLSKILELSSVIIKKISSNSLCLKEKLVHLFSEIGKTAIYVLKDLYVDREAIERGFAKEILEQYKTLFNLHNSFDNAKNFPEIKLNLENIDIGNINLEEFKLAYIVLLGLMPIWLPFLRISKGYEREQALEIRAVIDQVYEQVSIISERFHHLENMYLTDFAFTETFHLKWFSEIFSIALDILSGGEFIIWQFSKLVIALEIYVAERKNEDSPEQNYSVRDLIIVPVLKAAYIFSMSHTLAGTINTEIIDKLKTYIDFDELKEWETDYQEYSLESLLLFALSELIRLLREKFLDAIQNLRVYTSFILDTLQILIDIKTDVEHLEDYHIIKNLIQQFIIEKDSRFQSLKILFPLEAEIEQMLFDDEPAFTPDEAEEFLQIGRFYGLPKLNWVLEIAKRMAGILKINLKKSTETYETLNYPVIGLTMVTLTKDFQGITNSDLLIPIARSTLMALNFPSNIVKEIVNMYGELMGI